MRPEDLGFVGNPLDRAANRRSDAAWLKSLLDDVATRYLYINADKTLIADGAIQYGAERGGGEPVLLGLDEEQRAVFATRCGDEPGLVDLRTLAAEGRLTPPQLGILAQARSLISWHDRHGFCANCGAATASADGGYRRHCANCKTDHFPRTDPVMIIIVRHGTRYLLGRQSSWPAGRYSALAGFIEPGETIEDAARREVFEESGIRTGVIRYVASQPWPYPSSLMIGLIGEALDERIDLDGQELEDARWFSQDEMHQILAGAHPQGLTAPPPMAIAHLLVREALKG